MERDGHNKSIWQENHLQAFNSEISKHYDVVVVGGGITGVSTALKLQEQGRSCLIIEANKIGFGTTAGTSAHLNTVLDTPYTDIINKHGLEKAKLVAESARQAISIIQRNVARHSIDCNFFKCNGYMFATNSEEKDSLIGIKDAIREVGTCCEETKSVPLHDTFDYAIEFDEQGYFHPTKYLKGLLDAFISLGGNVIERVVVEATEANGDHLQIQTSSGLKVTAHDVVYATHTPPGIQLMSFRLAPYRSYIQVWGLADAADYTDAVIYDMKEPFHYIRPLKMGTQRYLMIGGQDHKTAAHQNEKLNFLELEAFVRANYNVTDKAYQWSSQYYESQDSLPFIGHYPGPGNDRLYLATGFGGNGMIFGSLSAEIITELILDGENRYANLYSPARFGPLSSIGAALRDNLDVVKHFVADRFAVNKIDGLAELARGEGKVLRYDGENIGIFKDLHGKIHAINPTCTHAMCTVKWNNTEYSWDCPCHGARYSPDGDLLNGPTVKNLNRFDLQK